MNSEINFIAVLACFTFVGTHAYRETSVDGVTTILATEGETFKLHCEVDSAVQYCTFHGPKGFQKYSITDGDVNNGMCGLPRTMSAEEVGKWYCHVGGRQSVIEVTFELNVRMVDKLAAVVPNISVAHGDDVTLECITTEGLIPLSYCRFEPPNGKPFRLDSSVNKTNPLFKKYYYPEHKSLDRGDCAVTIHKVKYSDVGEWKCGAGLNINKGWNKEYMDSITLVVQDSKWGVVLGSIVGVVVIIAIAYIAWRKRQMLGLTRQHSERNESDADAPVELEPMAQSTIPLNPDDAPRIVVDSASTTSPSSSGSPPEIQAGHSQLGPGGTRFRVRRSPSPTRTQQESLTQIRSSSSDLAQPRISASHDQAGLNLSRDDSQTKLSASLDQVNLKMGDKSGSSSS